MQSRKIVDRVDAISLENNDLKPLCETQFTYSNVSNFHTIIQNFHLRWQRSIFFMQTKRHLTNITKNSQHCGKTNLKLKIISKNIIQNENYFYSVLIFFYDSTNDISFFLVMKIRELKFKISFQ